METRELKIQIQFLDPKSKSSANTFAANENERRMRVATNQQQRLSSAPPQNLLPPQTSSISPKNQKINREMPAGLSAVSQRVLCLIFSSQKGHKCSTSHKHCTSIERNKQNRAHQPLLFQDEFFLVQHFFCSEVSHHFLVKSKNSHNSLRRPVGLWSCARHSEGKKKKTHVFWVFFEQCCESYELWFCPYFVVHMWGNIC